MFDVLAPKFEFEFCAFQLLTIALFGLKFLLLLKGCYEWLWEGQDVPIVEFLFPVMHMATLVRTPNPKPEF